RRRGQVDGAVLQLAVDLHHLVGDRCAVRGRGRGPERERPRGENAHEGHQGDAEHDHGHQELEKAEAALLFAQPSERTPKHDTRSGSAEGVLKAPAGPADTPPVWRRTPTRPSTPRAWSSRARSPLPTSQARASSCAFAGSWRSRSASSTAARPK